MERMNRTIRFALAAVLACAAFAGAAHAQDPAAGPSAAERTSSAMSGQKDAQSVIGSWPIGTKRAAQALIEKYGQPDGVTSRMLVWNDKDQWKEVAVYRDAVKQNLPIAREGFLQNTISYKVPENKVADLIKFDHALVIDMARGTLASYSDSEKSNMLALNLANEIVTGKRDVASAQGFLRSTLMKTMAGKSSPYEEKLMFKGSSKERSRSTAPVTPQQRTPPMQNPPGY